MTSATDVNSELQTKLSRAIEAASTEPIDADQPSSLTIASAAEWLMMLSVRLPGLAERAFVSVARDGSIEVVVTLPAWSYTVFVEDGEAEVVLLDRRTDAITDCRGSLQEALDILAKLAA